MLRGSDGAWGVCVTVGGSMRELFVMVEEFCILIVAVVTQIHM